MDFLGVVKRKASLWLHPRKAEVDLLTPLEKEAEARAGFLTATPTAWVSWKRRRKGQLNTKHTKAAQKQPDHDG